MSTCPRCGDGNARLIQRPAVDHYECDLCGWDWDYWPGGEKKPFAIRQLLGLPHDCNPGSRWCECAAPVRYAVNGTLGERIAYCRTCRKYINIIVPATLNHGGHYRALVKRQEELAAREVVA